MPILLEHVSFTYDGVHKALDDITFEIEDGSFLGVIGHTGSGKSTMTQLMNALLVPSEGRVLVDGIDTSVRKSRREIRAKVGLAFQYPETQLFASTVAEDVAFGPHNLGLSHDEVGQRVREALERVSLVYDEVAERSPFDLSGGQQRKVALAGIIAMRPSVLVLDEPGAGMDPQTMREIRANLRALNEQGTTIVLVSHSMEDVAELCSDAIVLEQGRLHMSGTPAEIFTAGNAEELRRINLGIPRAMKFALELKQCGVALQQPILSERQLADALLSKARGVVAHGRDFQ